jgi:hypothetical protein
MANGAWSVGGRIGQGFGKKTNPLLRFAFGDLAIIFAGPLAYI